MRSRKASKIGVGHLEEFMEKFGKVGRPLVNQIEIHTNTEIVSIFSFFLSHLL